MKHLTTLNPEHATPDEIKQYPTREAARAIVIDDHQNIALLHVITYNHYKIPGGGLEENEDPIIALHRECLEEIGCEIEVLSEIGSIIEYRKMFTLTQISYCYFAKVKGKKGEPQLTDEEVEGGFTPVWLPYDQAVQAITENQATTLEGSAYMVPRDTLFLQAAKEFIIK